MTSTSADRLRTVAVLQPGYLPWLGFFDQMARADVFVVYDDVQFDKHGWRNRNRIKGPGGPHWLTVPVRHSGRQSPPNHLIEIDNTQAWARKHVGTVRQFYHRAPFLDRYMPELEALLTRPWTLLVDLDLALIEWLRRHLGMSSPLHRSSQLGIEGGRSERLLRLCRHFQAGRYLSGNAAQDYLDRDLFQAAGVEVLWQDYAHPVYPQMHGNFVSHLSALDLLLNCGERSASIAGLLQRSA